MTRRTAKEVLLSSCRRLDVTPQEIMSDSRLGPLVRKRQEIMFDVFTQCPHMTYLSMGPFFNRDHTTVVHGVKAHAKLIGLSYEEAVAIRVKSYNEAGRDVPGWVKTWVNADVFTAMMQKYGATMRAAA